MSRRKFVNYSRTMTCRTGFHSSTSAKATLVLHAFNKAVDDPTAWSGARPYHGWSYLSFRPMWVTEPPNQEKDGK